MTLAEPRKNYPFIVPEMHDGCVCLEIIPTLACPVGCPGCDRASEPSELDDFSSVETLYRTVRADYDKIKFRISGGEPTLYGKINELIDCVRSLEPQKQVELVTNMLGFDRLKRKHIDHVTLLISVYPSTEEMLRKNPVTKLFWEKVIRKPIATTITEHEDMRNCGTVRRTDFNPFCCFGPLLMCNTGRVYPCCRAHTFEQWYGGMYHYAADTPGLLEKLAALIADTDLCSRCPRMYVDHGKIPTQ